MWALDDSSTRLLLIVGLAEWSSWERGSWARGVQVAEQQVKPKDSASRAYKGELNVILERTKSESARFKEATRELGCDEDEVRS